jgi:cytochrome c553
MDISTRAPRIGVVCSNMIDLVTYVDRMPIRGETGVALSFVERPLTLEEQSAVYIKAQLTAFASGERRNDISQQISNVARYMMPAESDELENYYASQPTAGAGAQSR